MKQGNLDAANDDFNAVLSIDRSNSEAAQKVDIIADLRQYVAQAKNFYQLNDLSSAEYYLNKALEVRNCLFFHLMGSSIVSKD